MTLQHQKTFDQLCTHARETALLAAAESALGWDERTMMPPEAAEYRAEQLTLLAGLIHQRRTDPRLGEWLGELAASPLASGNGEGAHSDVATTIRQLKREYDKRIKLPQSLVEELTRTASLAQHAWEIARSNDDFASFQPLLAKTFELKRAQADALGYVESRYDALVDDFEPGERSSNLEKVLAELRQALVPLVLAIAASSRRPDATIIARTFPLDAQSQFSREASAKIGFDYQRGRLDVTSHPFCTGLGPDDLRITTRYDEGKAHDRRSIVATKNMWDIRPKTEREHWNVPWPYAAAHSVSGHHLSQNLAIADKASFLGRYGSPAMPLAMTGAQTIDPGVDPNAGGFGRFGDACAALGGDLTIKAGETITLFFTIAISSDPKAVL